MTYDNTAPIAPFLIRCLRGCEHEIALLFEDNAKASVCARSMVLHTIVEIFMILKNWKCR